MDAPSNLMQVDVNLRVHAQNNTQYCPLDGLVQSVIYPSDDTKVTPNGDMKTSNAIVNRKQSITPEDIAKLFMDSYVIQMNGGLDMFMKPNHKNETRYSGISQEFTTIPLDPIGCPHSCEMPKIIRHLEPDEGIQLKPSVKHSLKKMNRRLIQEAVISGGRNIMCYMFLACLVCIVIKAAQGNLTLENHDEIALIVLCIFGFVSVPFQAVHTFRESKHKRETILSHMLKNARNKSDFLQATRDRQNASPYLALEVSLKTGALAHHTDEDHWTRTTRKTDCILNYSSWVDTSSSVNADKWKDGQPYWLVVGKDYRLADEATKKAIDSQVAEFSKETKYDTYQYFMSREFILDVQEGDFFPDLEAFLIVDEKYSKFYSFHVYTILLYLGLDSIYHLLFYCKTRRLADYFFVKFVEK